jgi:alpha-L-arabinofuranosidase
MTYISGSGEIGIENQSFNRWGMNIEARKPYDGYLYIRTSAPTTVYVAFESQSGTTVYAETSFTAYTPHWTRYDFTLTPNNSDPHGRFAIKLKESGSIDIGYAFVQPGAWGRFKNLPVRKDIAEGLAAQGNTFLRFGGSSVGSLVIDVGYRWKNMIGPRDARFATGGLFNPYGTNGWGIFEFLNLVEAMGVVGIPAVSINESSQDISAFIEYVNGPISTTGGQQRAADGHPEPYRLRYLELGNEEVVDENYFRRFKDLATAIWRKDPDIILIVGDLDPGSDLIGSLFHWHLQILNLARDQGREVWFDFHIWADDVDLPYQRYDAKVLDQVKALDTLFAPLSAGVPGAKYKFVVFELNANSYDAHRALANAIAIGALQRLGDKVRMVASANALQPDEQNDNVWDQGLLFFNPRLTWAQPPYYVTQMKARNYLPLVVNAQVSGRESVTFDVTVTRSADGHTLALHVVNTIDVARTYAFNLRGFHPQRNRAHVTTLAGARDARNSPAHLDAVAPSEADVPLDRFGDAVMFTFAPNSFTIVRLQ